MESRELLAHLKLNEKKGEEKKGKIRNSFYQVSVSKIKEEAAKPRSKSVSAVSATKPNCDALTEFPSVPAYFARNSVDPKTIQPDLALLEGNKEFENLKQHVIRHLTLDHSFNQEIAKGFNYLVIGEDLLKALKSKAEEREISNPLNLAAIVCLNVLWHQHLRPACQKLDLKSNSPQIDCIIQAMLTEFSGSNLKKDQNEMRKESSNKLDSDKLFNYLKDVINDEYKQELHRLRNLIKQAKLKKSAAEKKNQVMTKETKIKIEELKVPKKGEFISETFFTKEFVRLLGLEEKDLKEIMPIIFESIRTIDISGENSLLIASLKPKEPLYFQTESLISLFAKIKIEFKKLVKTYVNNEKLIKDVKEIKNKEIIKNSIVKAINIWLEEGLNDLKKKIDSNTSEIAVTETEEHMLKP